MVWALKNKGLVFFKKCTPIKMPSIEGIDMLLLKIGSFGLAEFKCVKETINILLCFYAIDDNDLRR